MPLARSKTSLAPSRHCVLAWAKGWARRKESRGSKVWRRSVSSSTWLKTTLSLDAGMPIRRQLGQRRDRVLLLLQGRDGRDHEVVEVLVAAAVLAHQGQQVFDVAGADVDDDVVDGLQVFLQLAELAAAQRAGPVVGVDAFDRDDLGAVDARRQEMAGDRRLADVAGEVNDGYFHGRSLLEREGW